MGHRGRTSAGAAVYPLLTAGRRALIVTLRGVTIGEDPPGGPETRASRDRVLDAAAALFATRGVSSISMDEIAEAGGVPKRAVSTMFATKGELVLALMDRHVRKRLELAAAAFRAAIAEHGDADELGTAWREVGDILIAATEADEASWQHLLFEYAGLARRNPELKTALARRRQEHLAAVAAQVAQTAAARKFSLPINPGELAVTMLALSNGLALEASIDPSAVPADLLGRVIALLAGRSAPPGGAITRPTTPRR